MLILMLIFGFVSTLAIILLSWKLYKMSLNYKNLKNTTNDEKLDLEILEAKTSYIFKIFSIIFTIISAVFLSFYYYVNTKKLAIDISTQQIGLASNFVSLAGNIKEEDVLSSSATIEALSNYAAGLQDYGKEYIQKPLNVIIITMNFTRKKIEQNAKSENRNEYDLLLGTCMKSVGYVLRANKYEKLNFNGADLSHMDLEKVYLRKASLWGVDLHQAYLGDADLSGAFMQEAHLNGSPELKKRNMRDTNDVTNMVRVDLREAYLLRADLSDAYLGGADLSNAYLAGANLSNAYLGGANLSGADLASAQNLTPEQLESAVIDKNTILPIEFEKDREKLLKISKENLKVFKEEQKFKKQILESKIPGG